MKLTNKSKDKIAKEMFGLFFEDINYAADGGLYAEMIENRSFEAKEAFGLPGSFYTVDDNGYAWSAVCDVNGKMPRMQYVQGTSLSEVNPHYLRFTAYEKGQGFKNQAYDGILLKKGMNYKISFYARCVKYSGEGLTVSIEKDGNVAASIPVTLKKAAKYTPYCDVEPAFISGWTVVDECGAQYRKLDLNKYAKESEWVKYEAEIIADTDVRNADFVIRLDEDGIVEFDMISMLPGDAVAGVFRKDLFDALDSMHPGFIRFPGGCIVEGISLENRYRWKNTVGEIKDRKYIPNLWAFDDSRDKEDLETQRQDAHYGQSYGIGFYEYFLLCELLGAKPLPVLGIGVACQFRSDEMIAYDDERLTEYIQDAIDLIEFANGDISTKWGSLRAKMGHPESFNLEMVAVGNEQWDTTNVHLFERIDAFEKAIHKVYPDIKLLGTAGPNVDYAMAKEAWDTYRAKQAENSSYVYAVDEHYYVSPEWMYEHVTMYDNYPKEVAVFAGEYAAHPEDKENTMAGALAEAAFLTGIEKNAGAVKLASYAPLFNRVGHSQWKPDMIWFDDKEVYYTPSYYVQKMYANNVGDVTIDLEGEDIVLRSKGIYVSVTKREDGAFILKAVNCSKSDFDLEISDEKGCSINKKVNITILKSTGNKSENMPEVTDYSSTDIMIEGILKLAAETFTVAII